MNASLESPSKTPDKHDRLALCQALLIELGVTTTEASIPRSHKAAKALLQSTVHINIVDYLAVRKQGLDALRKIMHPSRKSLRATLHKKRAKLSKVKACGLHALLVSC
ncbi:hypothetical protein BS47DRAFT_1001948 [Hydnum rufescens UP504]|uniref:Uncharacterized protein n=1 Tax=Hydnum rufescens UP504 TaxID=1448309 RepID=A0A9P6B9C0_9AGAM|nr:hypothetical protein BS47DRAFT_1001948 [Hydnum rufescens UP504]